jgi:hypothetical protein
VRPSEHMIITKHLTPFSATRTALEDQTPALRDELLKYAFLIQDSHDPQTFMNLDPLIMTILCYLAASL